MKINLLSPKIYNRISAGEVVEKPASIVKELVENSLDAGATKIKVEIYDGGIREITVTDNGCGIEKEDLPLAFLPHATSKISDVDDLDAIMTLGFRGEALASICAVSMVKLSTLSKGAETGYLIEANGGDIGKISEVARVAGTTISVRNLFYNTPVRAKFLRKPKTEEGEITHLIEKFMLARPDVSFEYIVDDKQIYKTTSSSLKDVIYLIYGREVYDNLLTLNLKMDDVEVSGYISAPKLSKPNRTAQTLFVNGRYIENYLVSSSVQSVYESFLMKGRFPVYVLSIEVPPNSVDVNVHPSKNEVKFDNPNKIFGLVRNAIENDNFDFVLSTSGSTAIPKCVKINIDKMFSNILFDNNLWKVNKNSKFLNWLPISHIYGLTSIVFIPLYFGATSYLMRPHDYYNDCYLWIKSISKYKITHTSIINFALNQLSLIDNIKDNINLSSLQNLSIGGESVKLNSVRTFYNKYKKYNLNFNVFSPSYGMSENSGLVSEYKSNFGQPLSIKVDRKLLIEGKMKEDNEGIEIVNLGQIDKNNVLISSKNGDYYNFDDEIGEVVLNDKSLCLGYLNNNQEFPKYFHTGDLGFIHNDCLYLCGRIKDIIIIRGKNFASSLICDTISNILSKANVGINTFITLPNNDDSIYFVQEVLKPLNTQALKLEIQEVIKSYTKYDIPLENIILIKSSDLPKLSSGKLDKITLTNLIIGSVLK